MIRLVVCSAVKHKTTGVIVCGPRHGDCLNSVVRYELDKCPQSENWECGFVDQNGVFLTRTEAWVVADIAGQIRRPTGLERHYDYHRKPNVGDDGMLFSENLY